MILRKKGEGATLPMFLIVVLIIALSALFVIGAMFIPKAKQGGAEITKEWDVPNPELRVTKEAKIPPTSCENICRNDPNKYENWACMEKKENNPDGNKGCAKPTRYAASAGNDWCSNQRNGKDQCCCGAPELPDACPGTKTTIEKMLTDPSYEPGSIEQMMFDACCDPVFDFKKEINGHETEAADPWPGLMWAQGNDENPANPNWAKTRQRMYRYFYWLGLSDTKTRKGILCRYLEKDNNFDIQIGYDASNNVNLEKYCNTNGIDNIKQRALDEKITMVWSKPLVYFYPKKTTEIKFGIRSPQKFLVLDPLPANNNWNYPEWSFSATPQSELTIVPDKANNGAKNYDYIFYETDAPAEVFNRNYPGWQIPLSEFDTWMNKTLPELGLNEKETKDFYDFWSENLKEYAPNLKEYKYLRITMMDYESLDELGKLEISPIPDTIIRVDFIIEPTNDDSLASITQTPKISTPERKGFVVAEWGVFLKTDKIVK